MIGMAIDFPLQMEGKLSLVASFDDLMRCATVLNTGCEAGKQVLNQSEHLAVMRLMAVAWCLS